MPKELMLEDIEVSILEKAEELMLEDIEGPMPEEVEIVLRAFEDLIFAIPFLISITLLFECLVLRASTTLMSLFIISKPFPFPSQARFLNCRKRPAVRTGGNIALAK